MRTRTLVFFLLILISITSCETVIRNTPDLQNEGRSLADKYYASRKRQSLPGVDSIISVEQDTAELHNLIRKFDKLCGVLISYEIQSISAEKINNSEEITTKYVVTTNCEYEKGETLETLILIKKNDQLIFDDYIYKINIKH